MNKLRKIFILLFGIMASVQVMAQDNAGHQNVSEHNQMPGAGRNENRCVQAHNNAHNQKADGDGGIDPLIQLGVTEHKAQSNRFQNEEHAGGGYAAVGDDFGAVGGKAIKGTGNHIGEGRYDQNAAHRPQSFRR